MAKLDELGGLGDVITTASEISSEQIAEALRGRPRLAHKKDALQTLAAIDSSAVAAVVVEVQSGRLANGELVDRVARLAEAAAP